MCRDGCGRVFVGGSSLLASSFHSFSALSAARFISSDIRSNVSERRVKLYVSFFGFIVGEDILVKTIA